MGAVFKKQSRINGKVIFYGSEKSITITNYWCKIEFVGKMEYYYN
jgi:hypothetical protein